MKTRNKKVSQIKKFILPAIIVAALTTGVIVYAFVNTSPKEPSAETTQPDNTPVNDPVPEEPTPSTNNSKENLGEETPVTEADQSIIITSASVNNNILQVRTLIQKLVSEGSCTLTISRDSTVLLTRTATIQAGPSSSTCKGFDVSLEAVSDGPISVTVSYSDGTNVSTSEARQVQGIR